MKASGKKHNVSDDLNWILNIATDFDKEELSQTCFKKISEDYQQQVSKTETILEQEIYSFQLSEQKFQQIPFRLIPNIMLMKDKQNTYFLILSGCTIEKKVLQYKEYHAFGIILQNYLGNTYLFFNKFISCRNWYKLLKQYCKLSNYASKYKICEQIMTRMFITLKKKNNTLYNSQIYLKSDIQQCPELGEVLANEIHLLRSIKHQGLLEIRGVYEDPKHICLVYEYYKCESLFYLISSGQILEESQIASVIYQSLQVLKFLQQHSFYHGNISPITLVINTQMSMLQILLINLVFKEYKNGDKILWLINRTCEGFLAPELYEGNAPDINSDLYSLGVVLYFITFIVSPIGQYQVTSFLFQILQFQNEEKFFFSHMSEFSLKENVIQEGLKIIQNNLKLESPNSIKFNQLNFQEQKKKYKMLYSASQIDLIIRLTEKDPNKRIKLENALKHQWFLNVKAKLKAGKGDRPQKKSLPILRTIIELQEQSDLDMKLQQDNKKKGSNQKIDAFLSPTSKFKQKEKSVSFLNIDYDDQNVEEEETKVCELMQELQQEELRPSKMNHENSKTFKHFQTIQQNDEKSESDKLFEKSKTISYSVNKQEFDK